MSVETLYWITLTGGNFDVCKLSIFFFKKLKITIFAFFSIHKWIHSNFEFQWLSFFHPNDKSNHKYQNSREGFIVMNSQSFRLFFFRVDKSYWNCMQQDLVASFTMTFVTSNQNIYECSFFFPFCEKKNLSKFLYQLQSIDNYPFDENHEKFKHFSILIILASAFNHMRLFMVTFSLLFVNWLFPKSRTIPEPYNQQRHLLKTCRISFHFHAKLCLVFFHQRNTIFMWSWRSFHWFISCVSIFILFLKLPVTFHSWKLTPEKSFFFSLVQASISPQCDCMCTISCHLSNFFTLKHRTQSHIVCMCDFFRFSTKKLYQKKNN